MNSKVTGGEVCAKKKTCKTNSLHPVYKELLDSNKPNKLNEAVTHSSNAGQLARMAMLKGS